MGISDVFVTGTPYIYVLIGWDAIETGTTLDVSLFQGNRLMAQQSVTTSRPHPQAPSVDLDGGFAILFQPDGGFAAGEYTAELDYHGLPEQIATFEVNDTGFAPPVPGNPGLGPSGASTDLGPMPYADPRDVLIVTRSSVLRQHMGAEADAVLAAAAAVGSVHDLDTDLGGSAHRSRRPCAVQIVHGLLEGHLFATC